MYGHMCLVSIMAHLVSAMAPGLKPSGHCGNRCVMGTRGIKVIHEPLFNVMIHVYLLIAYGVM